MMNRSFRVALHAIIVAATVASAPAQEAASPTERSPGMVLGYNKNASGSIQGVCHPAAKDTLACDFTEVLLLGPFTRDADEQERQMVAAIKADPEKAKQEMTTTAAQMRDGRDRAKDAIGPKGKQNFDSVLTAAESGDPERLAHALTERGRHRCHLFVFTYAPTFRRIGVRKWLSERTTGGPCRSVQVWELSSDDDRALAWNIKSTTVDPGNTSGPCAPLAKTANEVTEWNIKNPNEYEPPCDFITYFQ